MELLIALREHYNQFGEFVWQGLAQNEARSQAANASSRGGGGDYPIVLTVVVRHDFIIGVHAVDREEHAERHRLRTGGARVLATVAEGVRAD